MEKLYYRIPYIRQFEAKVVSCEKGKKGFEVILDRTAFYPEGEASRLIRERLEQPEYWMSMRGERR